MNESATSLDRLHDIVVPSPVPLWPPAPGWYVVIAIVIGCLAWGGYRWWKTWRANAYRRDALRDLSSVNSIAEVAELLRRVALAIAPRSDVASQTGGQWPEWLATHCSEPMPTAVREQLTTGLYQPSPNGDVRALKVYAANWIAHHQPPSAG